MDDNFSETSLLQHLETLALQLEIEVRYENLTLHGCQQGQ